MFDGLHRQINIFTNLQFTSGAEGFGADLRFLQMFQNYNLELEKMKRWGNVGLRRWLNSKPTLA